MITLGIAPAPAVGGAGRLPGHHIKVFLLTSRGEAAVGSVMALSSPVE